ncbi:MAG: NAD(P)-dependent glycerol-3-phosphate dehydrogenase [Actinomycetota bacterium]|nr:NAD(P)-dependent glycerol-3-phosphate dehydrogenase [Actinomycetota bacterium]
MVQKVAVIGAGSWGTTFALLCSDAANSATLWARRQELAEEINETHRNEDYLPGVELPEDLHATADAAQALRGSDVVVLAIPSVWLTEQLREWGHLIPPDATVVSLAKGVEAETLRRGSQIVIETLDCQPDRVVVVSGPNIASEIAQRLPAATVAAASDERRAIAARHACMTSHFRVYTNPDPIGCETGGATKNVLAIAAGIADGMGLGHNAKATLVTRGLAEMARLGVALGGKPLTFLGLAGVGDLIVTCSSPKSRNRTVGERLGRGERLDEIVLGMRMVAEGVRSSTAIVALARRTGVEMPISEAVVKVVHEGLNPADLVASLMTREPKPELHGLPQQETALLAGNWP